MSILLGLARDHFDRMSNPAYGPSVNEEYSLRFAALLQREGVQGALEEGILGLRNAELLTSHGWIWLLGWARSERLQLHEELLLEVFDHWSNVFLKAAVLEAGTAQGDQAEEGDPVAISPFLRNIITRVTHADESLRDEERSVATRRAEEALLAMLHVESDATLAAARALIGREWPGKTQLRAFLDATVSTLAPEAQERWAQVLRLRSNSDFRPR